MFRSWHGDQPDPASWRRANLQEVARMILRVSILAIVDPINIMGAHPNRIA